MLMMAYVLDKEINGGKILQDIESLINKYRLSNQSEVPVLMISIKNISRDDTSLIPKLEHKILEPDCVT